MNDQAFTDVTLATLDNQHVSAHKIILSSGSTFFKNILVRNLHQNPLIYLKDITSNHSKCQETLAKTAKTVRLSSATTIRNSSATTQFCHKYSRNSKMCS